MHEQGDGAIQTIFNYSTKSEDNFFICCTSASNQIYSRGLLSIRSCSHSIIWFRMERSMKQTTPSYTQLGQDRGFKKQPGFWGFFEDGGDGKKCNLSQWSDCLCSRSWMFGGRNQSGRWDLLIHPLGLGAAATCRGLCYEPYSHKQTPTHTNSPSAVNSTIHVSPVWPRGYVFTAY